MLRGDTNIAREAVLVSALVFGATIPTDHTTIGLEGLKAVDMKYVALVGMIVI